MPPAAGAADASPTPQQEANHASFPWTWADAAAGEGSSRQLWRGHRDAVLTLDVLSEAGGQAQSLASGSEDSTVRVWDLTTGRTTRCYHGPFGGEAVAAVAFGDAGRLFAATSTDVFELDLRAPGVVLREARAKLAGLATDDINQLSVQRHPRTGAPKHLAVADDSGRVTLLDATATPPRPIRTLARRGGGEEAMCTCVSFRPRAQWDLACGFLQQCAVGLWDFGRARCRALEVGAAPPAVCEAEEEDDPTVAPPSQLFNPPYVHGLAFDASGRHLATALGSGEVLVYEYSRANHPSSINGGPLPLARLSGGHVSSVAGVCFLEQQGSLGGEGAGAGAGDWLRLASVGNDCVLALWECPAAGAAPASAGGRPTPPRVVHRIEGLPGKPNWVVSAPSPDSGVRVFVANTTRDIAVILLRPGEAARQREEEGGAAEADDEA